MKKRKEWARGEQQGSMRWERDRVCLALQWRDNRPVTILTLIDHANDYVHVDRNNNQRIPMTKLVDYVILRRKMLVNLQLLVYFCS